MKIKTYSIETNCFDINTKVELQDGTKIPLSQVSEGIFIKSANEYYIHNYASKLDIIPNTRDIIYSRIKRIYYNKKILFQIVTNTKKTITCSLSQKIKAMRRMDGLNNYKMKPLCELLDEIEPNNFTRNINEEIHHLITEDGIEDIISFCGVGEKETIDIEIDNPNNQFFANGILVSSYNKDIN